MSAATAHPLGDRMTINLEPPTAAQTLVAALDAEDSADELARAPFTPIYLLQVLAGAVSALLDAQGLTAAESAQFVRALVQSEDAHV